MALFGVVSWWGVGGLAGGNLSLSWGPWRFPGCVCVCGWGGALVAVYPRLSVERSACARLAFLGLSAGKLQ